MLFSYNWLKEYVPGLPSPKTIVAEFTTHAVEVESVSSLGNFDNIVVGKIETVEKHPNADRLRVCKVNDGTTTHNVVCGGSNLEVGMLIALAKVGSRVKWHGEGELITLAPAKIRDVASEGMICASVEIGLAEQFPSKDNHEILDLSGTKAKPGTELSELFGDTVIDIDNKSMTHRPDLFSHQGLARELAAVFHLPVHLPQVKPLPRSTPTIKADVQVPDVCRRYRSIEMDVTVGQSPEFMRKRLEACGIKSINNIVDITNIILLDYGQPVHAFDADKVSSHLIVRRAKKGEKVTTLDHKTHELDESVLVIADTKHALDIAGIIGGMESAITEHTKRIILEVAHFDAVTIRKASQKVNVRTDGTLRWEKGPSEDMPTYSAPAAVALLQQYADAVVKGAVDLYPKKKKPHTIKLPAAAITRLTGIEIPKKDVVGILKSCECTVKTSVGKNTTYTITPPWFRMDMEIKEDVIEDLVRLYGINNIPEQKLVATLSTPPADAELQTVRTVRNTLKNLGCTEVYNYSFYGDELIKKCGLVAEKEHVEILNPLNDELRYLRVSVLPRMLETIARNQNHETQLAFFEVGHVYFADREVRQLGIMIMDDKNAYRQVRGIAESLLSQMHLPFAVQPMEQTANCEFWGMYAGAQGMQATIDGAITGSMGEVASSIANNFDVRKPVAFCVLSIPVIATAKCTSSLMNPLPVYPAIPLDLSLIVDKQTTWGEVESTVKKHTKGLLQSVQVFDVYSGKGIPEGKKSIAFRMILQSNDKTLEMADMEALRDKIVTEANKRFGAVLRDK